MKKTEFIKLVSEATGIDIIAAYCYGDTVSVGFLNDKKEWVRVGIHQLKANTWYSQEHLERIIEAVNNVSKQGNPAFISSELTPYQLRKQFK